MAMSIRVSLTSAQAAPKAPASEDGTDTGSESDNSPRMYKQRFLKWKWQKYNNPQVGMRKGAKSGSTVNAGRRNLPHSLHIPHAHHHGQQQQQQRKRRRVSTSPATSPTEEDETSTSDFNPSPTHLIPHARRDSEPRLLLTPHDAPETYHLNSVLHGWSSYLHHWATADPRFVTPTKFHVLPGAGASLSYVSQDFRSAIQHLQRGETVTGGRLLRFGFLRLEEAILDDHVECVWVLCIMIPLMLLDAGYRGLLEMYLRHVGGILRARMGAAHPLNRIVRDIRALSRYSSASPPSPSSPSSTSSASTPPPSAGAPSINTLTRYAVAAGTLWVDTFTSLRGGADAVSLMLRNAFFGTLGPAHASHAFIEAYLRDMDGLASEAAQMWGEGSVEAVGREAEALDKRWKHRGVVRVGPGEMLGRVERLLVRVEGLRADSSLQDGSMESPTVANPKRKIGEAYLRCFMLQTLLADHMGDVDMSGAALRRFLANRNEHDVYFKCACMDLEPHLRAKGRQAEAEMVQCVRLGEQVPEEIMRELDQAEGEGVAMVLGVVEDGVGDEDDERE